MNPDRHIYPITIVLAAVLAAAIYVLTPRDPFAGTTVHRETTVSQANPPQAVEVAARTPTVPRRTGTAL